MTTGAVGVGDAVLLTGATGFLGSRILKRILEQNRSTRVFLLVRGGGRESARERVDALLSRTLGPAEADVHRGRVAAVQGDISRPDLGIDPRAASELHDALDHVIHCAATVRFDLPLEEARRDNTEGTRHVLAFTDGVRHLGRLDYVGTAFVAGQREGLVMEDDLDVGQTFRNSYEQSKMEAEKLVREFAVSHPTAIYRPSIVMGDSKTGATTSFQGASQILVFYRQFFSRGMVVPIPADPATRLDIVPVDYVVDAFFALMHTQKCIGNVFHLASGPENTCTLDELMDMTTRFTGLKRPQCISLETFREKIEPALRATLKGWALDVLAKGDKYIPYAFTKLLFDKTHTDACLLGTGIKTPHPSTYYEKLLQFQEQALKVGS
jgi:thioester reductase-like protein